MACNTRCHSGPYYPRPLRFCSGSCSDSPNTVLNPALPSTNFAMAIATGIGQIENGGTVPLDIINSNGSTIFMNVLGDINLTAGTYAITYNVSGILSQNNDFSFGLYLNGVLIETSQSHLSGDYYDDGSLSNQVIITVTQNSVVRLVNIGDSATLTTANMSVTRL